jgi:hypothetical protein
MEFVMNGVEEAPQLMPPPAKASLSVMMQLAMVGEEELPILMPPPFSDVKPLVIVNPSKMALMPAAKVTTLPILPPSITVDSGPFSEKRVMFVLLPGNRIFS